MQLAIVYIIKGSNAKYREKIDDDKDKGIERERNVDRESKKREREMKKEIGEKKTERFNIVSDFKGLETFAWCFRSLFSFLSFRHL